MSGRKCPRCGLVNGAEAEGCGRCGAAVAATDSAGTHAAEGAEGRGQRTSTRWQVARALMWAVVVYVGFVAAVSLLARLYDWATGAPPMPTGAPHNFPKNPFVLLAMLVIFLAPLVYFVIAGILFFIFERREAERYGRRLN